MNQILDVEQELEACVAVCLLFFIFFWVQALPLTSYMTG